ncbi:GntR family transcriptional regulator [Arthrobacter sp. SD76]|uniref:GntR family transcriptional regulator n=1 Tax=Arthrobacter sp. SD76 TaxID=3415007 RepID=UPI003C74452C
MKATAVDKAYVWLRQRILDGTLPGGTFIDEATVCEAAGVSRTPAREAFNRLEGERFITRVPRRGAQVRELNSSDLHDAYDARFMVESFAATEFCAAGHKVPEAMYRNLEIMDENADFEDEAAALRYLEADQAFHAALVQTLGNRPVIDFFSHSVPTKPVGCNHPVAMAEIGGLRFSKPRSAPRYR